MEEWAYIGAEFAAFLHENGIPRRLIEAAYNIDNYGAMDPQAERLRDYFRSLGISRRFLSSFKVIHRMNCPYRGELRSVHPDCPGCIADFAWDRQGGHGGVRTGGYHGGSRRPEVEHGGGGGEGARGAYSGGSRPETEQGGDQYDGPSESDDDGDEGEEQRRTPAGRQGGGGARARADDGGRRGRHDGHRGDPPPYEP